MWGRSTRDELLKFLRGLDEGLEAPTELLVIGGAAALRYGAHTIETIGLSWHDGPAKKNIRELVDRGNGGSSSSQQAGSGLCW